MELDTVTSSKKVAFFVYNTKIHGFLKVNVIHMIYYNISFWDSKKMEIKWQVAYHMYR